MQCIWYRRGDYEDKLLQIQFLVNSIPSWLGKGGLVSPPFVAPYVVASSPPPTDTIRSFRVESISSDFVLQVDALFDPLSSTAQTISTTLLSLCKHFNVSLRVYLLPKPVLSEIPLKNFHREVFSPLNFDENGEYFYITLASCPQRLDLSPQTPCLWTFLFPKCDFNFVSSTF